MSADRTIIEAVRKLAGTHLSDDVKFVDCTVDDVDQESGTCSATPIGENSPTQITGIQLEAEVCDGLLIIPVIGSTISVIYSTRNSPYAYKFSDIEEVIYSGKKWQFGNGEFGGLVKVIELAERIARIEIFCNTHVHSGVTSGSATTGVPGALIEPITIRSDLENIDVLHGG